MNLKNADSFSQLHIDIARNSTDDFNLFHDSRNWHKIKDNPFNGPITLGFQLESLLEGKIAAFRRQADEESVQVLQQLHFSNYQCNFVNAVKAGQALLVEIKPSQFKTEPEPVLSNRVTVKSNAELVLLGFKKESTKPLYLADADFSTLPDLHAQTDRCMLANGYFFKRKFITTSNAKNFLCASLRDQTEYFDELQNKVVFPEMFPCALLSSALLEKALHKQHDFQNNPMVYTSHKISVDKRCLAALASNDELDILIRPADNSAEHDFGEPVATALDYECYGLVRANQVLFRALISLTPLELILKALQ